VHSGAMEEIIRDIAISLTVAGSAITFALMTWAGHQH